MTPASRLAALRRGVLHRRLLDAALTALPLALAAVALAALRFGAAAALAVAVGCIAAFLGFAWRTLRALDERWLVRRLDAALPELEDSADLLLADPAALADLARLQQARVATRFAAARVELRPPWHRRRMFASLLVASAALLALAPQRGPAPVGQGVASPQSAPASTAELAGVEVEVRPPAYTGLPARSETALDLEAPEGAALRFRLRFRPEPARVALAFHDGARLELRPQGGRWEGDYRLARSTLYRLEVDGASFAADPGLHRLDARPDRAPEIRVLRPEHTLTLLAEGQASWDLAFEVTDDYGVAAAELALVHAQGTGEAVRFNEEVLPLAGEALDGPRRMRYATSLALARFRLEPGDELVARLRVRDGREPEPNLSRSASYILRWPAPQAAETGALEGVVERNLPAYFRSQRQIIIDSEALIAGEPTLAPERFLARSDALGVDQKALRLRYGQFLGEEDEAGGIGHAEDEHDEAPQAFGTAGDVTAEYGHVHDSAEAATLFDPATKATLREALDAMWQAELELRQGAPARALPHEYRALEAIKTVQQATRIYLARVGLELPPLDEGRRLGGKREGLTDRPDYPGAPAAPADPLAALWQALGEPASAPDWAAAERALAALPDEAATLDLVAALDAARRDPACVACRERLRALLWRRLPPPATAALPRPVPDAEERRWLEASTTTEPAR